VIVFSTSGRMVTVIGIDIFRAIQGKFPVSFLLISGG
jgi:hypothetical protein